MQERAKGAQHIYQSQKRKEKHLETQNEPNPSPSIPQSSKRSQIALKCVFFVKIRKKQQREKMLEKIKELRVKAECAKALLALADDETERKHFKKLLDKYKQELLKFLDEPQPKPSRSEPNEPKKLGAILADNQTDLNAIDDENTNPLFDELAEQKGAN